MEFNYFKTSVMSVMAAGAFAFSASVMGASPVSVLPHEGQQETLEDFTLVFAEGDEVAWSVTGTSDAPYLTRNGERIATVGNPNWLKAEGNQLMLNFNDEFIRAGEYQLNIAAGSYKVNGEAGDECHYKWDVTGLGGYSVEPAVNTLTELSYVKITFNEADKVTVGELDTFNCPFIEYVNEEGMREVRHRLQAEAYGNTLFVHTFNNAAITEPGEYVVVVPGITYFLDGEPGENLEFSYTVIEPTYPEVELSVNPATDVVESIENIEVTFGGVDVVEWAVTGTENAPYLVDANGERMGTFMKLGGLGNMLSLGLYSEFTKKGNYTVIIPEGAYVLQGIYHGMAGKEIKLNYEVLGLGGYSVEPSTNVVDEINIVKITFNEADVVTIAEELGTTNTPYCDIVTAEGVRERRATLYPEAHGNDLILHPYPYGGQPITEPGEYVVVVPGTCYFLDGEAGEDIELIYTVAEPSYPEIDLSVNPATDVVETIGTIEVTFGGVDIVEWAVTGTENAPYLVDANGERMATFMELGGLGNMLSLGLYSEYTKKGNCTVIIPEGSYVLQGIYHGMAGKEIRLNFEVLGLGGYSVEPSTDVVNEINVVKITFNEAEVVTLAEELGTTNTPYCDIVTEEGVRERRATLYPEAHGNDLILHPYPYGGEPITEPGQYIVVIPGSCYFLDGEAGENIELLYTVIDGGTVAVSSVFGDKENHDVYDINGRLIIRNADANAIKDLRGIYVIGGKKYIIR